MIVFTDSNGVIYDVGENTTGDESLNRIEITDENNPFAGWSKGKICCYKCQVIDGRVVMMTPAVDSRLIRNFDNDSKAIETITPYTVTKNAYIDDTEVVFTDVPDGNMSVYVKDNEGNYPLYTVERTGNIVTVHFDPLETVTTVTISVIGG